MRASYVFVLGVEKDSCGTILKHAQVRETTSGPMHWILYRMLLSLWVLLLSLLVVVVVVVAVVVVVVVVVDPNLLSAKRLPFCVAALRRSEARAMSSDLYMPSSELRQ